MQVLRLFFSPLGRLRPQAFLAGVAAVYAIAIGSQWLTMPDVIARAGLWLFVAAQALLIWAWYALHAKRLRDGGRPIGLAAGAAVLYVLSVALLLIVAASFFNSANGDVVDANTAGALGLLLMVAIVIELLGAPHYDLVWTVIAALTFAAFVPVVVVLATTLWAATRPSLQASE